MPKLYHVSIVYADALMIMFVAKLRELAISIHARKAKRY
jgi:hypothetical protein